MLAINLGFPPQPAQVSICKSNTRFRGRVKLIAMCSGVGGIGESAATAVRFKVPVPWCAGVMVALSLLCSANTP